MPFFACSAALTAATAEKVFRNDGLSREGISDAQITTLALDILEQALTGEFVGPARDQF